MFLSRPVQRVQDRDVHLVPLDLHRSIPFAQQLMGFQGTGGSLNTDCPLTIHPPLPNKYPFLDAKCLRAPIQFRDWDLPYLQ